MERRDMKHMKQLNKIKKVIGDWERDQIGGDLGMYRICEVLKED